jgi:nucleoside-diphosphate-sugar epimerase
MGMGTGPMKRGANYYVNRVLERKKAFIVGEGTNVFDRVSVQDVASALVALVEAAAKEIEEEKDIGDWNEKGYYFVTPSESSPPQMEYGRAVAKLLREEGLVETEELGSAELGRDDEVTSVWDDHVGWSDQMRGEEIEGEAGVGESRGEVGWCFEEGDCCRN